MKIKTLFFLAISLIAFTSCSTSYHKAWGMPLEPKLGYSDAQIDEDHFVITFQSNNLTSQTVAFQYAMRRAAEVSLTNGFPCFEILSVRNEMDVVEGLYGIKHRYPAVTLQIRGVYTGQDCYIASEILHGVER